MKLQGNGSHKSMPTTFHVVNGSNCRTQLLAEESWAEGSTSGNLSKGSIPGKKIKFQDYYNTSNCFSRLKVFGLVPELTFGRVPHRSSLSLTRSCSQRKRDSLNGFENFCLKARARTWSRLSYMCHIRSIATRVSRHAGLHGLVVDNVDMFLPKSIGNTFS